MSKADIMASVTRTFGRMSLKLKKHTPEILIVTGVVGGVVSAVMACKATRKIDTILEPVKEKIDQIHEGIETGEINGVACTEEDAKKELAVVYAKTGLEFVKLYGPSVALGAVSIGCILTSHRIVHKRNVALAAAYTAVHKDFKQYRGRLIDRFGKELDKELKYGIVAKEVEEKTVDENGNEVVTKKVINVVNPHEFNEFTRIYDVGCTGWSKDPEMNKYFLLQQQQYANDLLYTRGHVFLNEVYDMLGFQRTGIGAQVGWYYDKTKSREDQEGDGFVDFGILDQDNPRKVAFINGDERSIVLDFNIDGVILDYI